MPLCGKDPSSLVPSLGEEGQEWSDTDNATDKRYNETVMSTQTARKERGQPPSTFDVTPSTVVLNVLGYREDGEWVALALEMDLRGYGGTFGEALQELKDLVATQIRFAQFKGQSELVWKPAEAVWFERFADTRRERLNALVQHREPSDSSYDVAGLVLPPSHSLGLEVPQFVPIET
jgi:hypothetical protein